MSAKSDSVTAAEGRRCGGERCAPCRLLLAAALLAALALLPRCQGQDKPMAATHTTSVYTNHLAGATSPYLLQHAHNPVDWYPWGDEALARARREDKPIFLSIGYSACHWCHVMAHESFEDPETARLLNAHFISIKVDREERPDLDAVYMAAVQAMTGSGGWPMSVFLTPDLKPFYGGTYFPKEARFGMPAFKSVLRSVAKAYKERRGEIAASADRLVDAIRRAAKTDRPGDVTLGAGPIAAGVEAWRAAFDPRWGGFGGAPKFPPATALRVLLTQHYRTGDAETLNMVTVTLDRMAWGGMYDQLGGGFHRYATDRRWLVPHFEKMLYDNALLTVAYLEAYQVTGKPRYARVARETLDYLLRDMRDAGGGFHSAQAADSEGEEGKFYVWTPQEIKQTLGPGDGALFCRYYGVTAGGNFEGRSILNVPVPPEAFAKTATVTPENLATRLAAMRAKLLAVRARRVPPGKDDKVLADWNGLAVSALARGYAVLGEERYRRAAEEAARFILNRMTDGRGLLHAHRAGKSHTPAYLDDYAYVAAGLVDLYEAAFEPAHLAEAARLADRMIARFWDADGGGFYQTPAGQKDLVARMKRTHDGARPNGGAVAARTLARLGKLTDRAAYLEKAEATLRAHHAVAARAPTAAAASLLALDFYLGPVQEVAIAGTRDAPGTAALLATVRGRFLPHAVVAWIDPASADARRYAEGVALLKDRPVVDGRATAYVCRNFACKQPVTSAEALAGQLAEK